MVESEGQEERETSGLPMLHDRHQLMGHQYKAQDWC